MDSTNFFVAGGTLHDSSPSYVRRPADDLLLKLVTKGELCYILDTRQAGKSSLMVRTIKALRLQASALRTVEIDLTNIGDAPPEQWYYTLADEIAYQLRLTVDVYAWWQENKALAPASCFIRFLRNVVLADVHDLIVIFLDEVDSILKYPYSDSFIAAIRALYNKRASAHEFEHISFVLIGTVAPNELMRDQTRTPFNVGHRIILEDLQLEDSQILLDGLPNKSAALLERIFYWTNGHPYLTQKIGQEIALQNDNSTWTTDKVDRLIRALFLTDHAFLTETNLADISKRILSSPQKEQLLALYRRILDNRVKTHHEAQSSLQDELKLSGLIRVTSQGYLVPRNRIYEEVFNLKWLRKNQPINRWRRIAYLIATLSIFLILALSYLLWSRPQPELFLPTAVRVDIPPTMDGSLEDSPWRGVRLLTFATHSSANGSTRASVKLLWDDENLYVGFDVNDTQVEGANNTPWDGDSVALVLDHGSTVAEYRYSLWEADRADTKGAMVSKHQLKHGTTLNEPSDNDIGYTVEMQIPWGAMPSQGQIIAIDLLSVDHDQNPGGKFDDSRTIFSKITWDGDQSVDTTHQHIQLATGCAAAYFVSPQGSKERELAAQNVYSRTIMVAWEPSQCSMIVQYYDNDVLVKEDQDVVSGSTIDMGQLHTGPIELKIWSPGIAHPMDNMWIWVQ